MDNLILDCQQSALAELKQLADANRHSVLLCGPTGCGKLYTAKKYADMLGISDFAVVTPKVNEIRETIAACFSLSSPVVLCIRDLDTGVAGAAYTLLKFLEEPADNIYIVVTAQSTQSVPDTIVSRSAVVNIAAPSPGDIEKYASAVNFQKFYKLYETVLWKCVKSFKEVEYVLNMTPEQFAHFESIPGKMQFRDSVYNTYWGLVKYPDNTSVPPDLVIKYIMQVCPTVTIRTAGIDAIRDLATRRLSESAVFCKFLLTAKFVE